MLLPIPYPCHLLFPLLTLCTLSFCVFKRGRKRFLSPPVFREKQTQWHESRNSFLSFTCSPCWARLSQQTHHTLILRVQHTCVLFYTQITTVQKSNCNLIPFLYIYIKKNIFKKLWPWSEWKPFDTHNKLPSCHRGTLLANRNTYQKCLTWPRVEFYETNYKSSLNRFGSLVVCQWVKRKESETSKPKGGCVVWIPKKQNNNNPYCSFSFV